MKFKLSLLSFALANGLSLAYAKEVPVIDLNQDNAGVVSTLPPETSDQPPVAAPTNTANLSVQDRLNVLEQQMANLTQMNLPGKIDSLQQQVQQLNGELEVQAHTIQMLAQKSGQIDSGKTSASIPSAESSANTSDVAAPSASDANSTDAASNPIASAEANVTQNIAPAAPPQEAADYKAAFNLLMQKNNADATTAFQTFVEHYPAGSYTANAHYWLGGLYLQQNKMDLAESEYQTVIQQFPDNNKVPDAYLGLATLYDALGRQADAQQALKTLVEKFPNSRAAKTAQKRLQVTGVDNAS
ncbi:MAG: tol-pal system protein YbgF [Gammaproteobacteria bacterium]